MNPTHAPYMFLRNMELPQHSACPSAMIAIRSPSRSASSMKWVDKIIVRPARWRWRMFQVSLLASGSIPDVGSSRITNWQAACTFSGVWGQHFVAIERRLVASHRNIKYTLTHDTVIYFPLPRLVCLHFPPLQPPVDVLGLGIKTIITIHSLKSGQSEKIKVKIGLTRELIFKWNY